jgi:hypothetical protein
MGANTNMANQHFRRGQVIWALWQTHAGPFTVRPPISAIPTAFARRVVKLLELGVGLPAKSRAGQAGIDHGYSLSHAFELGVALDLVDVGLNQLEVAALILAIRQLLAAQSKVLDPDPMKAGRVFMVLVPKVVTEAHRIFDPIRSVSNYSKTIFPEPRFAQGFDGLVACLKELSGWRSRKCIIVDVRDLFLQLKSYLPQAPVTRRGRA